MTLRPRADRVAVMLSSRHQEVIAADVSSSRLLLGVVHLSYVVRSGDDTESHVAVRLRALEAKFCASPALAGAVLSLSARRADAPGIGPASMRSTSQPRDTTGTLVGGG